MTVGQLPAGRALAAQPDGNRHGRTRTPGGV